MANKQLEGVVSSKALDTKGDHAVDELFFEAPSLTVEHEFERHDSQTEEKIKDEQDQNDMDETMLRIAEEKLNNL